jgi:hypothetical protein
VSESKRRIVVMGAQFAGKTTMVQHWARSAGVKLRSFGVGSLASFLPEAALSPGDRRAATAIAGETFTASGALEVITLGGAVWHLDVWRELVREPGGLVLAIAPEPQWHGVNERVVRYLASSLPAPSATCIAMSKQDLPAARPAAERIQRLLEGTRFEAWPRFETRSDRPDTLLRPVRWIEDRWRA